MLACGVHAMALSNRGLPLRLADPLDGSYPWLKETRHSCGKLLQPGDSLDDQAGASEYG